MAVAAAALCLGVPTIAFAGALDSKQGVSGAADSAALAAADAAAGWIDAGVIEAEPCALAAQVTSAANVTLDECAFDATSGEVRVSVSTQTLLGFARSHAHAGPPNAQYS